MSEWLLTITYVFIPTILATGIYVEAGLHYPNIPTLLWFCIIAVLVLFPMQWGIIFYQGRRDEGKFNIHPATREYKKDKLWKVFLISSLLLGYAGIMSITVQPMENYLMEPMKQSIMGRLPNYFHWDNLKVLRIYGNPRMTLTCIVYFIVNVFLGPITEEFFFRGYLMNRMKKIGIFAPILNCVLFSLYHLWLPTNNLFRIVTFLPACYFVWKKKDLRYSIFFHCGCNLISTIGFIMSVMGW